MNKIIKVILTIGGVIAVVAVAFLLLPADRERFRDIQRQPLPETALEEEGKNIFRHDTFGNETHFTDTLNLPFQVLIATPAATREKTLGVLTDNDGKIVGIEEVVGEDDQRRWGITCAFCHSVVDENGLRQDGIPNTRLNIGAILALSPTIDSATRARFLSWGPGRLDITFNNEAEDGINNPAVIPPSFGLKGQKYFNWSAPFTNLGERNHFTMDIVAQGNGEFVPPERWGIVNESLGDGIDLIGPKMPALTAYINTLEPPAPKPGSFDPDKAAQGQKLFTGKADCIRCHTPPRYTNDGLVQPEEVGQDPKLANSPVFKTGVYKVPQLRGVWAVGPYFHDGSAERLIDVVNHYDRQFSIGLSENEKDELVEFLKSL